MSPDITSVLSIIGITLSLTAGTILLTFQRGKNSPRTILALYFYTVGYCMLLIYLVASGAILTFPHLFRTGVLGAYLFVPLAYLYVRQNVRQDDGTRYWYHFLPAILYVVDFMPFFFLPVSHKTAVIQALLDNDIDYLFAHREGWLTPNWFHLYFRNLVAGLYAFMSIRLLHRIDKVRHAEFQDQNASVIWWLRVFVTFQVLILAPYPVLAAIGRPELTFNATVIPLVIMASVTCLVLFFKPAIFYGFRGLLIQGGSEAFNSIQQPGAAKIHDQFAGVRDTKMAWRSISPRQIEYLSAEDTRLLAQSIMSSLAEKQSYLVPGYSINEFSKEIGIPVRKISTYVNHIEHMNFRDFLNRFRVEYCVGQLNQGAWQNLTLEGIALQCGFKNRNSFTAAFRKFSGSNPSAFMSQLKHDRRDTEA